MERQQLLIKIMSIGDPQVGKSCIIKRYCQGQFVPKYITTIGVDYGVRKLNLGNWNVAVNFFDLSGQEQYKQIRNSFIKDTQGVLLVFSLCSKPSFANLSKWQTVMKSNGLDLKDATVFIIANKSDQKNYEVEIAAGQNYARSRGYSFQVTSAKSGEGISELFEGMLARCISKIESSRRSIGR